MIRALFYLLFHSIKNGLLARLRRLKKPKYLAGAIMGGIYFYWFMFRPFFVGRGPAPPGLTAIPDSLAVFEILAATALLVIVFLSWILPHSRAALVFSEAEIAFLFPAPLNRRGLIHYKLVKSQFSILISVLFLSLLGGRYGGAGHAWIRAGGWWVLLCTLNMHFLGSSFAITRLMERGLSNWKRRLFILLLMAAAVAITVIWGGRTLRPPTPDDYANLKAIAAYLRAIAAAGPMPYLLFPFQIVVRPFLAGSAGQFFLALGPALAVMALHYFWVVRSNVGFEDASIKLSEKRAEMGAAVRAGNWQQARPSRKKRKAPFKLSPVGMPAVALLWKNLIAAGRIFSSRTIFVLMPLVIMLLIGLGETLKNSNLATALGFGLMMLAGWSLLIGPHVMRQDLRQDLRHADILKLYPLRGWQMVLGELAAPAVILTAGQWLGLLVAGGLLSEFSGHPISVAIRVAVGLGAALLIPFFNFLSLLIPNAAVLVFPGWFLGDRQSPQGIEATGQRIIFALGQFLVLALALAPVALVFALAFVAAKYFFGWVIAVPLAAMAGAIILGAEAAIGLNILGPLFERFDLSDEALK